MRKLYGFVLTSILFSTATYANKNIEWNLAMDWKTTLTPIASTSFKMARLVKEMTNERFIIKINGREKHNSQSSILELVQNANYEMGHTNSAKYKNIDINTIWFTGTPLGMTTKEQNTWFYYGNGQKLMTKVYDKFKVLSFPGGDLGTLNGGWFNKKIHTIKDLKGLQITDQGISSEILMMYGVKLKNIASTDLEEAFKKNELNVINGTSPSIDIKMGYHKFSPYFYTSWDRPASQMQFLVNKKAFQELPENYKKVLLTAMKTASLELYYENFYLNAKAWEKILHDYPNIQIKNLPPEVLKKLHKAKKLIFQQYSKENKLFKEIYEDQKKFLKQIRNWSLQEEKNYLNTTNHLN